MKRLLIIPFLLLFAACSTVQVKTPQDKLVAAETAFAVAAQTALGAYRAGVIKPGSDVDVAVDGALHAMHKALVNWRTNPEDPNFAQIALASLQVLLDTVNRLPTFTAPAAEKQAAADVKTDPVQRPDPMPAHAWASSAGATVGGDHHLGEIVSGRRGGSADHVLATLGRLGDRFGQYAAADSIYLPHTA